MDNRYIEIKSIGKEDFQLAMIIGFSKWDRSKQTVSGYKLIDNKLHLYDYSVESDKVIPFPYKMNVHEATEFCWGWLLKTEPKIKEPLHDGDNKNGFLLICEEWKSTNEFLVIEPIWAMYGK